MELSRADWEYIDERAASFVGREWVFVRVRRFLAGPPCVFLLYGDPGTGKTAVDARLAQDSSGHGAIENRMAVPAIGEGTISAAVFCRAGRADVVELTQRLSDQLAESVEGFGDQRLSLLAPAIKVGDVHVATGDVEAGASVAGVLINVGDERAFGQRVDREEVGVPIFLYTRNDVVKLSRQVSLEIEKIQAAGLQLHIQGRW